MPPSSEDVAPPSGIQPPSPRTRRFIAVPILWTIFAVLVGTGTWLFLRACALDAIGFNFCPADHALAAARAEAIVGQSLVQQVHLAQMAIAQAPVCAPPPALPSLSPARPIPLSPRQATNDMDRKVMERGGHNGTLQFTLSWATRDDLDLNVYCPGGRISNHRGEAGPGICGDGRKDIDANRNLTDNLSSSPIENVVWQGEIPNGEYKVEVIEYRAATARGNTVPFTLRIRWNDQERLCTGTVEDYPTLPPHLNGKGEVVNGIARVLTWTLGDGLPACDLQPMDTFKNGPAK